MDVQPQNVIAVMLMANGAVLMIHRIDTDQWEFPADQLLPDETPEDAVWRVVFARTGYRLGDVGRRLMRRVKDGCDATTFIVQVESQFTPTLDAKHDQAGWYNPKDVIAAAKTASSAPDPDQEFADALNAP
jgi:hypothetical protein